jgi:P27 family predicted phage terminase small subunit
VAGVRGHGGQGGRSGRKPQPTALKLLKGNPGRRPLNENEPRPAPRLPQAPAHLSEAAKKEWRRAGRMLLQLGLMSEMDRPAFALYCQAYGRWVETEEALRKYGVMVKSPSGFPMQSPYLAVANKAMEQMRSLLSEFGMTPASRTRVSAMPVDEEEDEFEALLRGAREARTGGV